MSAPIPCLLQRKILPKVWGGRSLERVLGIELPPGERIGESWEVYDRPEDSSRLQGSDLTLADLMRRSRDELLGDARSERGGRFPLLVKFVDATEVLSVQVHPGDEQAAEENDSGKTEAWVVLHAGARARIIRGVKAGVTRGQFEAIAATSQVESLLQAFTPRAGDAVFVPYGTVHAIGPDVLLYELQQNSDLTYRVYDWGRARETHLQKALRAIRFDLPPQSTVAPQPVGDGGEWLVRDPLFTLRRYEWNQQGTLPSEGRCKILTLAQGRAVLGWRSGDQHAPLLLRAGDTVLVPACCEAIYLSPIGRATFLWSEPGGGP
jgi:mannose-6-phosphate isomerase